MKLVDRLRRLETELDAAGMVMQADEVTSAIERIEAADAVDGELPVAVGHHMVIHAHRDLAERLLAYRALAERQDGGSDA